MYHRMIKINKKILDGSKVINFKGKSQSISLK
jgi:hypothetical protein